MNKKVLRRVANGIIVVGIALAVIGIADVAVNYPWRLVQKQLGMEVDDNLPDPEPLRTAYTYYDPANPSQDSASAEQLDSLPAGNNGLSLGRPRLNLTLIGSVKIPKIGISENLVEGTEEEMMYGLGHLTGSAYPGEAGNCVIAGHRNYIRMHPFRYLTKLEAGDTVAVEMDGIVYTYEIYQSFSVKPEETSVVLPQEGETAMLTLITCTPIPTYTERLICWGRLVSNEPKA